MTAEEYVQRLVASWPPLSVRQREVIQGVLGPVAEARRAPKRRAA